MTKKDYAAVARAIYMTRSYADKEAHWPATRALTMLTNKLIVAFEEDNPRFDATKFAEACNPSEPLEWLKPFH